MFPCNDIFILNCYKTTVFLQYLLFFCYNSHFFCLLVFDTICCIVFVLLCILWTLGCGGSLFFDSRWFFLFPPLDQDWISLFCWRERLVYCIQCLFRFVGVARLFYLVCVCIRCWKQHSILYFLFWLLHVLFLPYDYGCCWLVVVILDIFLLVLNFINPSLASLICSNPYLFFWILTLLLLFIILKLAFTFLLCLNTG